MASVELTKSRKKQKKIQKEIPDKRMSILGDFFGINEEEREARVIDYMLDHYTTYAAEKLLKPLRCKFSG